MDLILASVIFGIPIVVLAPERSLKIQLTLVKELEEQALNM
jgi:hypothetical protein